MTRRTHTTITDLYGHYQDLMGEAAAARSVDELREEFHARTGGNYEREGADFLDEIFEDEWAYGDVVSLEVTANAVLNCRKNWADPYWLSDPTRLQQDVNWDSPWPDFEDMTEADWLRWESHTAARPEDFPDPVERLRRIFEDWHFDTDDFKGPAEVDDYAIRLIGVLRESGLEITIRETETVKPPTIHELTSALEAAMGLVPDQADLLKRVQEYEKETD